MRKIIIVFVVLAVIIGIFGYWYWQRNDYSKEVLKLEILGPSEASLSQEVEYTVVYKNNGNITLEEPRLVFEFPEKTLLPEGTSNRQELTSEQLGGDIYPGQERTFKFKGRVFGAENEIKTAKVWLSYRPKNLKARYDSSTTFNLRISSVPLSFDFDLPSKIEADKDFKFSLNYFSSLDFPLTDIGIKIEYPQDFEYISSNPRSLGKNEWEMPILNKAEGGRIEISGRLRGEIKDQKMFIATLGVWQNDDFVTLKEITKGVEIMMPGLNVFQTINGAENYSANAGEVLHYEIVFQNIGREPFSDLFLVVRLQGDAFDYDSLETDSGQFNKEEKTIIWDKRKVSRLAFLDQGEEGKVEFWINIKDDLGAATLSKNLSVKNVVLLSKITQEFITKINSKLEVSQAGYFNDEIFGNSGPFPSKAGETTTYTITWQAKNYYNDLKNAKVRAFLPSNVSLTGKIYPESEISKFSFDSRSREIIWAIRDGDIMEAGTGVSSAPPIIAFQVALTPTSGQKGMVAPIIGEARFVGEDQWVEKIVEKRAPAINTTLPDDQNIPDHTGIIQ